MTTPERRRLRAYSATFVKGIVMVGGTVIIAIPSLIVFSLASLVMLALSVSPENIAHPAAYRAFNVEQKIQGLVIKRMMRRR